MLDHLPKKPTKRQIKENMDKLNEQQLKEKEAFEKELDKEHPMMFKKRELIVIFNMIVTSTMKYGDFAIFKPIIEKIEPIVAVASNVPEKQTGLTGVKN